MQKEKGDMKLYFWIAIGGSFFFFGLALGVWRAREVAFDQVAKIFCERIEDRASYEMCLESVRERFAYVRR